MKLPQMTGRGVLLLAIPFLAIVLIAVTLLLREERPNTYERDREELEKLVRERSNVRTVNPESAFSAFRRARTDTEGNAPASKITPRAAKDELLKLGKSVLPMLRKAIYDSSEKPLFRLELISIIGDMKGSEAEGLLVELLSDADLQERYRTLALTQLRGQQSDQVFNAVRKVFSEEPEYNNRHLLLKAIGDGNHSESTHLLIEAVQEPKESSSVRIQALDSLKNRTRQPGVIDVLKKVLFEHSEENVKVASIAALGKASDPSVEDLLLEVSENSAMSASVRKAAANWLEERRRQ